MIGAKDKKWGERPLAVVSLKKTQTATSSELKKHMDGFVAEDAGLRARITHSTMDRGPENYTRGIKYNKELVSQLKGPRGRVP